MRALTSILLNVIEIRNSCSWTCMCNCVYVYNSVVEGINGSQIPNWMMRFSESISRVEQRYQKCESPADTNTSSSLLPTPSLVPFLFCLTPNTMNGNNVCVWISIYYMYEYTYMGHFTLHFRLFFPSCWYCFG